MNDGAREEEKKNTHNYDAVVAKCEYYILLVEKSLNWSNEINANSTTQYMNTITYILYINWLLLQTENFPSDIFLWLFNAVTLDSVLTQNIIERILIQMAMRFVHSVFLSRS